MSDSFPHVILLSNYAPDRQPSMLLYAEGLASGLRARGISADILQPPVRLGKLLPRTSRLFKWAGYVDKLVLFPLELLFTLPLQKGGRSTVLHLCDHSNSPYAFFSRSLPVITTCHDAGAIRGALGELDDCPASAFGKILQRWICAGLRRSAHIACVSKATQQDVLRLVVHGKNPPVSVVPNGFNRPIGTQSEETSLALLKKDHARLLENPYILHVGSGLARKNREATVRIFSRFRGKVPSRLVFAGEPLSAPLQDLIRSLHLTEDDVVSIPSAPDELLEALYQKAYALLFPTRFEGFGWPVIEAQACGCPVLTTNVSSLPEVAGEGALIRSPLDEDGFLEDLFSLQNPATRQALISRGRENASRFSLEKMTNQFIALYQELA